jgi:DNA-binding transcriptional regulator YiaG
MTTGEYFRHSGDVECYDAPFHYRRSGLENIYLLNGFEAEEDDGETYVTVLDVDGLHKAIGMHLVTHRKVLAPKEIRFLRKTLDLTQGEMGRLIGQSDQQIARWEKGENNISGPADRLLRLMFAYTLQKEDDTVGLPIDFLSALDGLDAQPEESAAFCRNGADWRERVAA